MSGQLLYEWWHLKSKLRVRAPQLLQEFRGVTLPEPHPLFQIVPGEVNAGRSDEASPDRAVHSASRSMKVTCASLTTSSFTLQTPLALQIFPRALVNSTSMISTSPGRTGLRHFTSFAAMK